jgi:hypothetical protein
MRAVPTDSTPEFNPQTPTTAPTFSTPTGLCTRPGFGVSGMGPGEGMPRGLQPELLVALDVWAEAQTYPSNKRNGKGRRRFGLVRSITNNRRSFDCASRDETARGFAQDDNIYIYIYQSNAPTLIIGTAGPDGYRGSVWSAPLRATAGPSTAPLAMKLRAAPLRMTIYISIECLHFSCRNRSTFDCASRDETARGFAQDDNL